MLNFTEFTFFPTLPGELRCLIWEHSFSPRVVSLIVDSYAPNSPGSQNELYIKLPVLAKVSALQTCKESRKVALTQGYKAWNVEGADEATNMMWNPRIDVVFISGPYAKDMCMHTLHRLFPSETTAITRLALETSIFPRGMPHDRRRQLRQWVTCASLAELILVYDDVYERQCVQTAKDVFYELKATSCPWSIPRDFEYSLKTLDSVMPAVPVVGEEGIRRTELPKIRVVDNEEGIINGESLELNLRCWPCRDVGTREMTAKGLGVVYEGRRW